MIFSKEDRLEIQYLWPITILQFNITKNVVSSVDAV